MHTTYKLFLLATVMAFVACGGSPSSLPAPTPIVSTSEMQGIWHSGVGAASTVSAVVLPDGKLWAISSNAAGTRLIKAGFDVQGNSFVGTGKSYTSGTSTAIGISMTATAVEKSSLNGTITSAGVSEPFSLAYQASYAKSAILGDFVGAWSATMGPGTVNWTIGTSGVLSGTRTTGCTYAGQLSLRTEQKAVVNVALIETCAGAVTQLNGIAVKGEDKVSISMLLTTSDDVAAVAVNLK